MVNLILGTLACLFLLFLPKGSEGATQAETLPPRIASVAGEPVRVGIIPIADIAPLYAAIDQGYFEAERLKVELVPMKGGAVILPAMAGGSVDIGFTNVVSLLLAVEAGFDFVIIADVVHIGEKANAVLVTRDAAIGSFKDLSHKRVAVNALNGVAWMYVREAVARAGGQPDTIKWFEVPFPQMGAALVNGQVDAITTPEPFITTLKQEGRVRVLGYDMHVAQPGGPLAVFAAEKRWLGKKPELAGRFARALARGVDYINGQPKEARRIISQFTRIKPELAAIIQLAAWRKYIEPEELSRTFQIMLRHGLLKRQINLEEIIHSTARKSR